MGRGPTPKKPQAQLRGSGTRAQTAGGHENPDPWGDGVARRRRVQFSLVGTDVSEHARDALPSYARWVIVESGYYAHENPEIHRLSKLIIAWSVAFFVVLLAVSASSVARWVKLARRESGAGDEIATEAAANFVVYLLLQGLVLRIGVRAVASRNATCCRCCGRTTYLALFQLWYFALCALYAVSLVLASVALAMDAPLRYKTPILLTSLVNLLFSALISVYAWELRAALPPEEDDPKRASSQRDDDEKGAVVVIAPEHHHNATVIVEEV